ncbi:MAG TPA: recombinase RecA [Acidobacteriaceae bacterium]|jgi:hypothetical protein
MPSAQLLRQQIEAALSDRIPSALTPAPRVIRPTASTGIPALDQTLSGGLPIGAITELAGPECSGRTSLALSFVACLTNVGRVCAWVDVSDTLHPESAAAIGVDLDRLLWIRCGSPAQQLNLPGIVEKAHAPVPKVRRPSREVMPVIAPVGQIPNSKLQTPNSDHLQPVTCNPRSAPRPAPLRPVPKPYSRMDQALRATDLLLQAGGFSAIVLDMGSVAPEFALRVPLATWFRYRAAAERTHASVLLLTQHACTKSSAGLVLHCQPSQVDLGSTTVLTGAEHRIEIARERFSKVVDFTSRKPPQSDHSILWYSTTPWSSTQSANPAKTGRR